MRRIQFTRMEAAQLLIQLAFAFPIGQARDVALSMALDMRDYGPAEVKARCVTLGKFLRRKWRDHAGRQVVLFARKLAGVVEP